MEKRKTGAWSFWSQTGLIEENSILKAVFEHTPKHANDACGQVEYRCRSHGDARRSSETDPRSGCEEGDEAHLEEELSRSGLKNLRLRR